MMLGRGHSSQSARDHEMDSRDPDSPAVFPLEYGARSVTRGIGRFMGLEEDLSLSPFLPGHLVLATVLDRVGAVMTAPCR